MKSKARWILIGILVTFLVVGCTSAPQAPATDEPIDGGIEYGEHAHVEKIDIVLMESFPLQASAVLRIVVPDGCTEVEDITVSREEMVFSVKVTTKHAVAAVCTEAEVLFEETVSLDILDLDAGTYTVEAYGKSATFELTMKNSPLDG